MDIQEKLGQLLVGKRLMLSTAESCTGGKIAQMITSVPGCSAYYDGSIVCYSNKVKIDLLKVNPDDIDKYGAVSEQVVRQMAEGAISCLHTDCAIATSGIAGPGGGTTAKPVGTIWIAVATPYSVTAKCFKFGTERLKNISDSAETALQMLYDSLVGHYTVPPYNQQ